ncbi:ABC transporter ATP-binding protein [Rhizobium sp. CG5]|uniref:ABC transporter ATP-binding protein n=1 Tax=Rhizobium sp. CG5 TaxID=2726076 RepID=UPI0020331D43
MPVISNLLLNQTQTAASWLLFFFVGVLACWALRRYVEEAGMGVGTAIVQSARHRIGDHIASLPVGWFSPENTARLSHVVSHGMMEVAQLPAHLFTPLISSAVTPIVIVLALLALNWQMGLIALVALPILAGIFVIASRLGMAADEGFHHKAAATSQRIVEFAQAQSVLRAFNGEGGGTRFLEQAIEDQRKSGLKLIYMSAVSVVLNAWVVQVIFAALLIVGALWLNSSLGAGLEAETMIAVIVALMLANRFIDPLLDVAGYGEAMRSARGQLNAIRDIFAIAPLPQARSPQAPRDGSVEMRDVSFRYETAQPDVLKGVSLRIAPGSMTALVGASGSGKTTLVRLIARFFDVTGGSVAIGGIDVRDMSDDQLSGQISQIFQNTYLFQGSIGDNIRLGKPGASDTEVLEAARLAGVAEIIARLPQGLETPVGEGGARLSGGERQRISIARALIKAAPVLLVDEATAALDAENQAAIAETLARLRGKRTLIVIAHQLSTVAMADQIVVLDDGKIAEQGSHDELKTKGGLYSHFLAQRQTAKGWRIAA